MINIILATTQSQFQLIEKLAKIIWHEHYPSILSIEQIDYMLKSFNSVEAFKNHSKSGSLFFYMTYNHEVVGYMAITPESNFLFINKLYILKDFRGKGLAKKTMQFIEAKAKILSLSSIVLFVNKYNTNSILAYEKMGFVKIKSMITNIGNGFVMDDFEMEKTIDN